MLKINELSRLYLGIQGENEARTLTIDMSAWIALYPNGSVTIWHKRNGESEPTATGAVYDSETQTVTWQPTSTDTYYDGEGEAEFRLTESEVIKKSKSVITGVSPAVTLGGTTLGSDWQSYINAVDGLRAAAVTAKEAAEDAEEDAEDSAEDAEAYAIGKRGGADVESTDPAYHNNSKYWSDKANEMLNVTDVAGAQATTLSAGSSATAEFETGESGKVLKLGIPKGDKGDTGNTGPTPVISIGTVTTGDAGTSASASMDTTDPAHPVLSFTIPKGAKGDSGDGDMLAAAFAEATANDAGTYVTYDGGLYYLPEGHTANVTWANTTKTQVKIGGEVTALKSALSVLEPSASASDVGKMLKVKSVADGKVTEYEFGEGGGSIDPSVIAEAVDDWLDEHPEATTTVEDGSITYAKLDDDVQNGINFIDSIPVDATAVGWRLNESDGLCSSVSGYKMVKYKVTAGDTVKVVSDDRFQFQTVASVPASGQSNRVGITYGVGTFRVTVPNTATYLIVSTPTSSNASAYKVKTVKDRLIDDEADINNLDARVDTIESQLQRGDRNYKNTGNIVQYIPKNGVTGSARIDFESVDGFSSIKFTHCGENLIDMAKAKDEGYTETKNGVTGTVTNGCVHVEGKNTSNDWTLLFYGYMSSYNYWLPRGHYSFGWGIGCGTMNPDETFVNQGGSFIKETEWQAVQWYASVRGGHTVDWYWPLMLVCGDDVPKDYKPFVGETVTVNLPTTVYGGWIDITNHTLHVTKTVSGGTLVPVTETTYNLNPINLTKIDGINTIYSIDGTVTVSGVSPVTAKENYEEPVADCFTDNYYLSDKEDRIRTLEKSCMGTGDAFIFLTDAHIENNRNLSIPLIREIGKDCKISRMFCGGDISDGYGSNLEEYIRNVAKNFSGEIHYTMGNHEYMATTDNQMSYVFRNMKNNEIGVTDRGYYYVDNTQQKIRYIVLNGYKMNAQHTNWEVGYEQAQLDWLEDVALNIDAGWGVIVFMHNTFEIAWATGITADYEPGAKNVFDILDAYSGNGEVIAVFGGHMHLDAVKHTTGGIPVILTTCDKCQPYMSNGTADFDSSIRHIKTISEQAFDVVIVDRESKEIHMVRIGCPAWNLVDDVIGQDEYIEERVISYGS